MFKNLNKLPDAPHGCDFSRLKPWYVEQRARYLRQTLLLSRYDMPEARGILHHACHNVAGKLRVDAAPGLKGVLDRVRPGVRQVFERFDAEDKALGAEAGVEEVDRRLEWFTKKVSAQSERSEPARGASGRRTSEGGADDDGGTTEWAIADGGGRVQA